jgi:hypothetical protein
LTSTVSTHPVVQDLRSGFAASWQACAASSCLPSTDGQALSDPDFQAGCCALCAQDMGRNAELVSALQALEATRQSEGRSFFGPMPSLLDEVKGRVEVSPQFPAMLESLKAPLPQCSLFDSLKVPVPQWPRSQALTASLPQQDILRPGSFDFTLQSSSFPFLPKGCEVPDVEVLADTAFSGSAPVDVSPPASSTVGLTSELQQYQNWERPPSPGAAADAGGGIVQGLTPPQLLLPLNGKVLPLADFSGCVDTSLFTPPPLVTPTPPCLSVPGLPAAPCTSFLFPTLQGGSAIQLPTQQMCATAASSQTTQASMQASELGSAFGRGPARHQPTAFSVPWSFTVPSLRDSFPSVKLQIPVPTMS